MSNSYRQVCCPGSKQWIAGNYNTLKDEEICRMVTTNVEKLLTAPAEKHSADDVRSIRGKLVKLGIICIAAIVLIKFGLNNRS